MIEKSTLSAEDAKKSIGRHGKVIGSASYYYGQIVGVHESGDFLLFQRGRRGKILWKTIQSDLPTLYSQIAEAEASLRSNENIEGMEP